MLMKFLFALQITYTWFGLGVLAFCYVQKSGSIGTCKLSCVEQDSCKAIEGIQEYVNAGTKVFNCHGCSFWNTNCEWCVVSPTSAPALNIDNWCNHKNGRMVYKDCHIASCNSGSC